MQLTSRPSVAEDKDFLSQLYASTRQAEIAAFGWDEFQKNAFLNIQFNAQQNWYQTAYPHAEWRIILLDGKTIGRIIVARSANSAILVDISLLPDHCGQGFGTRLLHELLEQCQQDGLSLRLQVLRTNPAQRLYERLGFQRTGEDQIYLQMEWRPAETSAGSF